MELDLRNFDSALCFFDMLRGVMSVRLSLGGNFSFFDFNRDFNLF